jgi:PAS domain S-box-containing protein
MHAVDDLFTLPRARSLAHTLRELRQQNELLLNAAGEGIYGLDLEGRVTFVNPAAARMTGHDQSELLGASMHDLVHHTHSGGKLYEREQCHIYAAFRDGKFRRVGDEVFWRKDGSCFPVEYTSTPIQENGRVVGAVVVFRDITQRREAEQQLQSALREVERLKERLQAENRYLREEIREANDHGAIVGQSPALAEALRLVERAAPTDATVLIHGESGTGKELIAQAVHQSSRRNDRPLVKVNCGAISSGLVESELFGHQRGAFTGAVSQRVGRFELASGGTLFLDEVSELPLETQVKLLRVLQEGEYERVGSSHTQRADVRIIAATNRDLAEATRRGTFRSDLYFRLNVVPIQLPPLRERKSDIPLLVDQFLPRIARRIGQQVGRVSSCAMERLMAYDWPGNVRELLNVLERAAIVSDGPFIYLPDLGPLESGRVGCSHASFAPPAPGGELPCPESGVRDLGQVQRNHILRVLAESAWQIAGPGGAAQVLGMHPNTLRYRMKKLGIRRST